MAGIGITPVPAFALWGQCKKSVVKFLITTN
jgi:hypothetical protein